MGPYQPLGLPIDDVADEVSTAMRHGGAVITAEPGAGKSTVVPLLAAQAIDGTIYLSEPRRVAARATAQRLAELAGTEVGDGVGLIMRGEHRRSARSKIVVMTEGVLAQIIRSEPDLPGVGAVIFDEFHERSLHADLGLAMSVEARDALRPDLALVVMSATIDAIPISGLLGGAPIIAAAGRTFPVETVWSNRVPEARWAGHVAQLTATAAAQVRGSVIVLCPDVEDQRRHRRAGAARSVRRRTSWR
ncbi:MAG: DEAD/DEAH box helicase [Acidimicrobiales bacterium]